MHKARRHRRIQFKQRGDMPRASGAHGSRSTTPADVRIGNLIRAQRRSKALTQTELGKAVGISFQQIQKYENGVNRVPSARLAQIAKLLDVSLSDFFEGNANRNGEL